MPILPTVLDEFLLNNNFDFISLVQKNDRKDTYIIKIKKESTYYILKAYTDKTPSDIRMKFRSEINFYKNNYKKYLPKLIMSTENILILEYIDGVTLREYLITNKLNKDNLILLFSYINQLYEDNKEVKNNNLSYNNAFSHLSALTQSGPMQTKYIKISFFRKFFNLLNYTILKYKLKNILKKIDVSKLMIGFKHGDFHYNNILISKCEIKFIDFENISYQGVFDFDILYLLVMVEIYIKDNQELNNIFQQELSNIFNKNNDLIKIYYIYKRAISLNKRFKSMVI